MIQLRTFALTVILATAVGGCRQPDNAPASADPSAPAAVAQSREMGGAKSVMTFFVTSRGLGNGGSLGGLSGADAHCQALAQAKARGITRGAPI